MEIDPRFHDARASAKARRAAQHRRRIRRLVLLPGLLALALALAAAWASGLVRLGSRPAEQAAPLPDPDTQAQPPGFASSFIDIPGDPMVLRMQVQADKAERLPRPPGLPAARGLGQPHLIRDRLIAREERLMTTLPSSREDFAFFQQQRGAAPPPAPELPPDAASAPTGTEAPAPPPGDVQGEASWGSGIAGLSDAAPVAAPPPTRIENTTSTLTILPENRRRPLLSDHTLRVTLEQPLGQLLAAQGAPLAEAEAFAAEVSALQPELARISPGHVLALRLAEPAAVLSGEAATTNPADAPTDNPAFAAPKAGAERLVQLSIYGRERFLGSFALDEAGRVSPAADPWVRDDLFRLVDAPQTSAAPDLPRHRLLDALYSTALRNGLPQALVGEAMVMMARAFDLESFALPEEELLLLWLPLPGPGASGPDSGQILYVGLKGPGRSAQDCLVLPRRPGPGYDCSLPEGGAGRSYGRMRAGLAVPVQGVLTSGFGPRHHPILKVTRLHAGTDWAAQTGTPIHAAAAGRLVFAGPSGGYGNLVRIAHGKGLETRYAHLSQFAPGLEVGQQLQAEQLIGLVGTSGLSTGPHLHFEVYQDGTPVDAFGGGAEAVDQLVEQIIRIESGGRAEARNLASSATGLGQFIDGTWLRMMRSYRPDLASTLAPADQLALRSDPTLSREMVGHYARETEAYLRSRQHAITPGRLYLGHFLGAQGAHLVLSAAEDTALETLLPAEVIRANATILAGRNVAALKDWAEAKMRGSGQSAAAPARLSAEAQAWKQMIDGLLASAAP